MEQDISIYTQKIEYARATLWAPFYTVGMAVRFQGSPPINLLQKALRKLRVLYPPLASRVIIEPDGSARLTNQGVSEFPVKVLKRSSDTAFMNVFLEEERKPFPFYDGPLVKFFLLKNPNYSDLVAILPHVICDGYSMTHVMWDLLGLLNNPDCNVSIPPSPPSVTWTNIKHTFLDNLPLRGYVRVLNLIGGRNKILIGQKQYEKINECFWAGQLNEMLVETLPIKKTNYLTYNCKKHEIAVTGALFAAFLLAQKDLGLYASKLPYKISVPVNMRNQMLHPPDRAVGFYASSLELEIPIPKNQDFWSLAGICHQKIHNLIKKRQLLMRTLVLEEIDPRIIDYYVEAISCKRFDLLPKLFTHFIDPSENQNLLVVTNIGRVDPPQAGNRFPFMTLFPLPPTQYRKNLTVNALTVNGQMNIVIKNCTSRLNLEEIKMITHRAFHYLFDEN